MTNGIGTIQIKRERGVLVLQGLGATARGQKFIRQTSELGVSSMADPAFKSVLKTAVDEMLAQQALPL